MLTIGKLIEKYGNKIPTIQNIFGDNHVITKDDVENSLICRKYDESQTNMLFNYGLLYKDGNIDVYYSELQSIEIKPSSSTVSVYGGNITIVCFGIINVYKNNVLYKQVEQKINPILTIEGCEFNHVSNTMSICGNYTYNTNSYVIHAKYGYNGKIYNCTHTIYQDANKVSDWNLYEEITLLVKMQSSSYHIPNSGGVATMKMIKEYKEIYHKYDKFDTLIDTKESDIFSIDVTDDSVFYVDEPLEIIDGNIIQFPSQVVNASKKEYEVIGIYNNSKIKIVIEQNKGVVETFKNKFTFNDNTAIKKIKCDNSLNCSLSIPIISKTIRYLDLQEHDSIDNSNISVIYDSNSMFCDFDNKTMVLNININQNNELKTQTHNVFLTSNDKKLLLIIEQPHKKPINRFYDIVILSTDTLTTNIVKASEIVLKPLKTIYYDDGSIEKSNSMDVFDKFDIITYSDDNSTIKINKPKLVDFNGTHICKFEYSETNNYNPINLSISCRVVDNNGNAISGIYNKKILFQQKEKVSKQINITLNIIKNNCTSDLIAKNQSFIKIFDKKNNCIFNDKTSRFWVNKYSNNDLVYNNTLNLIVGEQYKFIVGDYYYDDKKISLQETYLIEEDDIGIDLELIL